MTGSSKLLIFGYCVLFIVVFCLLQDVEASNRIKRDLKFPKGASIALSAALANHFPKGPLTDGLNQIFEFDLGFPFPETAAYNGIVVDSLSKKKASEYFLEWSEAKPIFGKFKRREKRSSRVIEKKNLLERLENIMTRIGYDGSVCVSRFQCDLHHLVPGNSLIEDLLIGLFKLPNESDKAKEKDCDQYFPNCPVSVLHILLHSQQNFYDSK